MSDCRFGVSPVNNPDPHPEVTQIQHFQTSFPEKLLAQLKTNFIGILHGMGKRKFVQMVQLHDQDGHHTHVW